MMKIRLKEREEAVLDTLPITTTFKIRESSFVFMKVDVEGLTVQRKAARPWSELSEEEREATKPIKVLIPEGKTTVVCIDSGKVQFLNLIEKVQIVELDCAEIAKEKQTKVMKPQQLGGVRRPDEDSSS